MADYPRLQYQYKARLRRVSARFGTMLLQQWSNQQKLEIENLKLQREEVRALLPVKPKRLKRFNELTHMIRQKELEIAFSAQEDPDAKV